MAKRRGKGEGSISKRANGNYRAYVTKNGERIHYTGLSKTECQEWMKSTLNQIDNGLTIKGTKSNLSDYLINVWLKRQEATLSLNTYKDYLRYCEKDIIPALGNYKLKDLNLNLIDAFYMQMLGFGRGIPTIRYIHRVMHSALEDSINLGFLGQNPSDGATLPKNKNYRPITQVSLTEINETQKEGWDLLTKDFMEEEMKVWTESELSQFLISSLDSPRYALYDLEAKTGLRAGEIRGLLIKDLEFKDDHTLIKIRRQVQWVKSNGWMLSQPKTEAGIRTLRVGANTTRVLKEHLDRLDKIRAVNKKNWKEYGLLFPSTVGTPICLSNMRKEFNGLIKKAGVRKIRFHDMRHTVASILLSNKIPLVIVSKILGHSKPSVTSDIYYHFIPASSDEASRFMDELTPTEIDIDSLIVESITHSNDFQK